MNLRRTPVAVLAFLFAAISQAAARPVAASGEDNFAKPVFQVACPSQIKATSKPADKVIRRIPS